VFEVKIRDFVKDLWISFLFHFFACPKKRSKERTLSRRNFCFVALHKTVVETPPSRQKSGRVPPELSPTILRESYPMKKILNTIKKNTAGK